MVGSAVRILKNKDLTPSLTDVPSIKARITTQEIVDIVREGRER